MSEHDETDLGPNKPRLGDYKKFFSFSFPWLSFLPFRRRSLASKMAPKSAVMTVGAGAGAAEVVDRMMNIIRMLKRKNRH